MVIIFRIQKQNIFPVQFEFKLILKTIVKKKRNDRRKLNEINHVSVQTEQKIVAIGLKNRQFFSNDLSNKAHFSEFIYI